jgi:hypothetical protein
MRTSQEQRDHYVELLKEKYQLIEVQVVQVLMFLDGPPKPLILTFPRHHGRDVLEKIMETEYKQIFEFEKLINMESSLKPRRNINL